ncbi:DUF4393 domain-containing protein [Clostridium botulinum]|uniref:DUF4393 domain-containing protein n=1 Tax=Clostridium botulinum TaxID=1491 RepID=UPI00339D9AC0
MTLGINKLAEAAGKTLKVAPELYDDALKPSVQESGKLLGRIPKIINAALAPLDIWILNREYNIEKTKKLLAKNLENVSPEKIVSPEPHVAVPVLQAISYSMNSEELRNMYAKLLANSMNSDEQDNVHPCFVEIIKQLSPLDASNLSVFKGIVSYPIAEYILKSTYGETSLKTHVFLHNDQTSDIDLLSLSMSNLERLGLLTITYNSYLLGEHLYDNFKNHPIFVEAKNIINNPELSDKYMGWNEIYINKGIVSLTPLGRKFVDICI